MLYLIGLGLNEKGISLEGLEYVKKCKKVYMDGFTVDFPYSVGKLEKVLKKRIIVLDREDIESGSDKLIKEAKKEDIALVVYGSPLFATTHISLMLEAKKSGVKIKVIYAASIFDAIAQTGLQLYKFGKLISMPKWKESYEPDSFLKKVKENKSTSSHSLILIDIGFDFKDAIEQLESVYKKLGGGVKMDKMIVCSGMGTNRSKILYGKLSQLKKKKVLSPFCFVIPGKMHFLEKEVVEGFKV